MLCLLALALPLADPATDLELLVRWTGDEPRIADVRLRPPIEARVRNNATGRAHRIVRDGDGSSSGSREPRLGWTVERRRPDGTWLEVVGAHAVGCGQFDGDWRDQVVDLGPGDEHPIRWIPFWNVEMSLAPPGHYRARMHYRYSAGGPEADRPVGDALEGVAPFALVSEPVELEYRPAFRVDVEGVGALEPDAPTDLADLVRARVVNQGEEPRTVARNLPAPRGYPVWVRPTQRAKRPELDIEWPKPWKDGRADALRSRPVVLEPGASIALFGEDGLIPDHAFVLDWDAPEEAATTPPLEIVVFVKTPARTTPLGVASQPFRVARRTK